MDIGLRVGQDFIGDPVAYRSRAVDQFFVVQDGTRQEISGTDNLVPAGTFRVSSGTTVVIGYSTVGAFIELPADRFDAYLQQYSLDQVRAERARRKESAAPGRERFHRYAKALLSGAATSPAVTSPVGFRYEIVPEEDPTRRFGAFRGRLLYRERPLATALVEALLHSDPAVRLSARSDQQGRFALALPKPGVWLLRSVHMARAGWFSDADWESAWASLVFDMPAPP